MALSGRTSLGSPVVPLPPELDVDPLPGWLTHDATGSGHASGHLHRLGVIPWDRLTSLVSIRSMPLAGTTIDNRRRPFNRSVGHGDCLLAIERGIGGSISCRDGPWSEPVRPRHEFGSTDVVLGNNVE
jgi:hypothetical protein